MKHKKTTLPNGLRIITIPMKDNPTVTVLALVKTGSDYEAKDLNGLSHFLEHMCFKGTEKRPTALAIASELDALGSESNAFTDHELTGYYAKSAAGNFKKAFDVVSDIYMNSTFPEKEIEKEKGVIIEEINMYEDMPHRHVYEVFERVLYGDQPSGWPIIGSRENIRAMKRDDFLKYKRDHYVAEKTIIVVAGNIDQKEVLAEAKKSFAHIPTAAGKAKKKTKTGQNGPRVGLEYKKTDQAHFVLGVPTFPVNSAHAPALAVLSGLLGGGMSSRLFQILREEMGVCYYVRAGNELATDHGYLYIASGVDTKRVREVISVILAECARLADELVPEAELRKVKRHLVGTMKLGLEGSDSLAQFYGVQEVLGRPLQTPQEKARAIQAVTAQDIRKLAKKIFVAQKLNLALVGPYREGQEASFLNLLSF